MIVWKRNLYAIWAAELLAIAGFSTSMPIIPFYLQSMGVRSPHRLNVWVGLIQSTASIALGLVAPVWGRVADSYGRRPMLLRAMFGGALIIALMGFVTKPWQLLVLRIVQGLLTGTVSAATVLVASTVPEKELGSSMGLLQSAVFVGASLGPLIGGFISDFAGNRFNFFVTSLMLVSAGLLVLGFVREDFVPRKAPGSPLKNLIPNFAIVIESRTLLTLVFVGFAVQVANSIVNPILPLFIQKINSAQAFVATTSGLIIGLGALSSAVASVVIGRVSGRMGYQRAVVICIGGACLLYIPQAFVTTATQLLVLRMLEEFFLGGTMPSVNALIARNTEREAQGSVYGINTSVSSAGGALGPALGASAAILFGYSGPFLGTAGMLLVTSVAIMTVLRRRGSGASSR